MLPVPNPAVIYKALPDSGVLLSTESEVYFGLNSVGARVWELLPPVHQTLETLCAELSGQYPEVPAETIRADVVELLGDLEAQGLVLVRSPSEAAEHVAPHHPEAHRPEARRVG